MTCRMCDKIEPRGCGKTTCSVTGDVIKDFDHVCTESCLQNEQDTRTACKITENESYKYEKT